ncbi:hypothetical protein [Rhizobium tumorigenes]|uniref:Uncharacterized protein n=1 Tax=Rhizobium tumorigenes TaxID=2041385 RepID=A0AAF1K9M7_9HYPH|nr:hypothetical protein [Rhizobium tumorigenes]WFR96526.1 hypothetical protein PR017_05190 [Rhizobium tumorigenes]
MSARRGGKAVRNVQAGRGGFGNMFMVVVWCVEKRVGIGGA